LQEIAHSGRGKASEQPSSTLGRHNRTSGGQEGLSLECRVNLDSRLDDVDG
jgi:hypothetical protein